MTSTLGKDLLALEPLTGEQIRLVLDTAEPLKEISERAIQKVPTLRGATIVNLFFEASMRIDMVVIRHGASGAAQFLADRIESNVINAGDGTHEHPTQGLLDLLTLRDHFKTLQGLRVCICGDVLHSRVARSNIWGLTKMGAEVGVCGPRSLLPHGVEDLGVTVFDRIEDAIEWAQAH